MSFEDNEASEKLSGKKPKMKNNSVTLQKAIDMGEYNPSYLATFPEWHTLSRHVQFQFIRQALENRRLQLLTQWAEINNVLDFRLKPNLKDALRNIEINLKNIESDRENLYLQYSK